MQPDGGRPYRKQDTKYSLSLSRAPIPPGGAQKRHCTGSSGAELTRDFLLPLDDAPCVFFSLCKTLPLQRWWEPEAQEVSQPRHERGTAVEKIESDPIRTALCLEPES